MTDSTVLCACGCGQPTPLYKQSDPRIGAVKGQPAKYVKGHSHCKGAQYIENDDGCWVWNRHVNAEGYPVYDATKRYAHRVFYELATGDDITNKHIHHECGNPLCVNPDHLVAICASTHSRVHATHKDDALIQASGNRVSPNRKVTFEDAERIRELYAAGMLQRDIGSMYGISHSAVSLIVHNRTYVIGEREH